MIDWQKLARAETHPLRVRMLEAIEGSREPVSAITLAPTVGAYGGKVSYHLAELVKAELIELDHTEQRRGAQEKFFRAVSS